MLRPCDRLYVSLARDSSGVRREDAADESRCLGAEQRRSGLLQLSELPTSDGAPMESARHRLQRNVLIDTLADAWAADVEVVAREVLCATGRIAVQPPARR